MEYLTSMLMAPIHSARPVDARWLRIKDLADYGGRAVGEYDDEWIRRGLRYVIRIRQIRNQRDREWLLGDFLDIDVAYQLHTSPDTMKRCLVEARLLARQSVEEVAAICGLSAEGVVAYEKVFFQVLGRLEAFLFIIPNAIGIPLGDDGLREQDTEKFIKLYAYQKGPARPGLKIIRRPLAAAIHSSSAPTGEIAPRGGHSVPLLARSSLSPASTRSPIGQHTFLSPSR